VVALGRQAALAAVRGGGRGRVAVRALLLARRGARVRLLARRAAPAASGRTGLLG